MAKPRMSIISAKPVFTEQASSMSNDITEEILEHIQNKNIHVDTDFVDAVKYAIEYMNKHIENNNIHVSLEEKTKWDSKESPEGAQSKANKVMNSLNAHMIDKSTHMTKTEKELLKDKYTKAETRNLLKHALTGLIFLEPVNTRYELDIKFPKPAINSCTYIRKEKITLVFNGEKWVDFNGLFTPEVTKEFDGLMSNSDKEKLDSIESNANCYIHPDNVDIRHVSDVQIKSWDNKAENRLATVLDNGLMSNKDKVKLNNIEENANHYEHPETHEPEIINQNSNNRFVSDKEKDSWNNKVEKTYVDSSIEKTLATAKAFTDTKVANIFNSTEEQLQVLRSLAFELKQDDIVKKFFDLYNECVKNKEFNEHSLNQNIHMSREDASLLTNVKTLLENRINPDYNEIDPTSPKYICNKPESLPANGGNADTVKGYDVDELLNNRSFYDVVIGTPEYDISEVSITTDKETLTKSIKNIISVLGKNIYTVLFKPGVYDINDTLTIMASNATISGFGEITNFKNISIEIIGNNNIIENISIDGSKGKTGIKVLGSNNIIRNNTITNYDFGITVEGYGNRIINNNILSIRYTGIKLSSDSNGSYNNIITMNSISKASTGISLISNLILMQNNITKNYIYNCNNGIILSNINSDSTKTTMNIINENICMRGAGKDSDYLASNKSIASEFSSKNIISSNITSGKEIFAPNDVVTNNIF